MSNTARTRGHNFERLIAKELREIYNDDTICTSRSESKNLDDQKIDIADPHNVMNWYCQLKCTQNVPEIKKINKEVGRKDKPLVILWNAQEKRDKKQVSVGEYAIMPKNFFYYLLKNNVKIREIERESKETRRETSEIQGGD